MKIKDLILFTAVVLIFANVETLGQQKGIGAGIIVGEPTGFSIKGWLNETSALDAGVAWSFQSPGSFHLHADYLWHDFEALNSTETIPLYYGVGWRIKTGGSHIETRVGVRIVFGVDYLFKKTPVDIFAEVAPILDFAPSTELSGNGGIGVRFWFR